MTSQIVNKSWKCSNTTKQEGQKSVQQVKTTKLEFARKIKEKWESDIPPKNPMEAYEESEHQYTEHHTSHSASTSTQNHTYINDNVLHSSTTSDTHHSGRQSQPQHHTNMNSNFKSTKRKLLRPAKQY
jgi:hypothetical protein